MTQPFESPGNTPVTGAPVPPAQPATGAVPVAGETSTKDVAKDQAAGVAADAKEGGRQVAETAKDEAAYVAETAKQEARQVAETASAHARGLFGEARAELTDQVGTQQSRLAEGLRAFGSDLSGMARGEAPAQDGLALDLARMASSRIDDAAHWLEHREPADVLVEVKRYARRKPGTFLAVAALTGLVAGRLTRSLADDARADDEADRRYARPATGYRTYGTETAYTTQPAYRPVYGETAQPAYDQGFAPAPVQTEYDARDLGDVRRSQGDLGGDRR